MPKEQGHSSTQEWTCTEIQVRRAGRSCMGFQLTTICKIEPQQCLLESDKPPMRRQSQNLAGQGNTTKEKKNQMARVEKLKYAGCACQLGNEQAEQHRGRDKSRFFLTRNYFPRGSRV